MSSRERGAITDSFERQVDLLAKQGDYTLKTNYAFVVFGQFCFGTEVLDR